MRYVYPFDRVRVQLYGPPELVRAQLVTFELGELGVSGELASVRMQLHPLVVEHWIKLVRRWLELDAWRHVVTVDKSYHVAAGYWGAHAWGSAVDINTRWNPLKSAGAAPGELGSTHELEDVARSLGWTCGRVWRVGRAPRHFEYLQPQAPLS